MDVQANSTCLRHGKIQQSLGRDDLISMYSKVDFEMHGLVPDKQQYIVSFNCIQMLHLSGQNRHYLFWNVQLAIWQ